MMRRIQFKSACVKGVKKTIPAKRVGLQMLIQRTDKTDFPVAALNQVFRHSTGADVEIGKNDIVIVILFRIRAAVEENEGNLDNVRDFLEAVCIDGKHTVRTFHRGFQKRAVLFFFCVSVVGNQVKRRGDFEFRTALLNSENQVIEQIQQIILNQFAG